MTEPDELANLQDNWDGAASEDRADSLDGPQLVVDVEGFQGPLDLLLALARTHKIDIAQISILELVEQYLAYIEAAKQLDLEIAAEYLVMAAWLAFLKSKLLLPVIEDAREEISGEEMAARLAFRLRRLDAMRRAGENLMARQQLGIDVFQRGSPERMRTVSTTEHTATIYDLLKAYAEQRNRSIKPVHVVKKRTVWSIKEARVRLERLVGEIGSQWSTLEGFVRQYLPTPELRRTVVASSLGATLEMAREGLVELRQDEPFGPIYVRRKSDGAEWVKL
ncbi:MAG: hypothetical protein RLZ98_3453 [Pseudomonadota bacterium]|jgi:segregation and condensation protein A